MVQTSGWSHTFVTNHPILAPCALPQLLSFCNNNLTSHQLFGLNWICNTPKFDAVYERTLLLTNFKVGKKPVVENQIKV